MLWPALAMKWKKATSVTTSWLALFWPSATPEYEPGKCLAV
jgi:hypothetical protein